MSDDGNSMAVDSADDVAEFFWRGCAEQVLWLQHCTSCGCWQHYPRVLCSHCWSREIQWRQPTGQAVVESVSIVNRGAGAFADLAPYAVALVRFAEGPQMLTHIVDTDLDQLTIGMQVWLRFEQRAGRMLPVFAATELTAS